MPAEPTSSSPASSTAPTAQRLAVVEEVMRLAEGDGALFYTIADVGDGLRALSNLVAIGAAEPAAGRIDELFSRHRGQVPDPRAARAAESAGFLDAASLFGSWERFAERPFSRSMRELAGIGDQIRLLAFQGDHYLGWIGAFRQWDKPRFGARERQRLAGVVPRIISQLAAADAAEREGLPGTAGFIVVRPDGEVEHASAEGQVWLSRTPFREALARVVKALPLDDGAAPVERPVWRARARLTRLEGSDGPRHLVCLEPNAELRRPALSRLSPTQRRVATLVADGLRRKEIAELLGLGEETVRSHVREIYRRLEVADRFELLRLIQAQVER